jgi:hypothetical protein
MIHDRALGGTGPPAVTITGTKESSNSTKIELF